MPISPLASSITYMTKPKLKSSVKSPKNSRSLGHKVSNMLESPGGYFSKISIFRPHLRPIRISWGGTQASALTLQMISTCNEVWESGSRLTQLLLYLFPWMHNWCPKLRTAQQTWLLTPFHILGLLQSSPSSDCSSSKSKLYSNFFLFSSVPTSNPPGNSSTLT